MERLILEGDNLKSERKKTRDFNRSLKWALDYKKIKAFVKKNVWQQRKMRFIGGIEIFASLKW